MSPFVAEAEPPARSQPIAEDAPAPDADVLRILIIDDAPAIHNDFRKILGKAEAPGLGEARAAFFGESSAPSKKVSFRLDSATQGQEGLALVERALREDRPYALAFVDIRMPPGWDGIETISRLWAVDPDLQIVICTAFSDYSWEQVAEQFGSTDGLLILKKPFDSVEALQLAHALTRKWVLGRQAKARVADLDSLVGQRTSDLRAVNDRLLMEMAERKLAQGRLSAFSALGQRLSAAPTAKAAGEIIVEVADELLGWDACLLDLYSPTENILCQVLNADIIEGKRTEWTPKDDCRPPSGLYLKAIQEGGQLILKADPTRMRPGSVPVGDTSRPSASIMFVPIRNAGRVIGVLSIQSYTPNAYNQRSLETLQALADHCGGALDRIRTEEDKRAGDGRYRSLFANMVEGVAYCQMIFEDGRPNDFLYLSVNQAFEKLTGLKDVVGKRVTEVLPGLRESNPEVFEIYGRVSQTGQAESFEHYFPGLHAWLAITAYGTGKGCFAAVFDNVTARKQAELRLGAFSALGHDLSAAQSAVEAARIVVEAADRLIGWDACTCDVYSPEQDILIHLLEMDIINDKRTECPPTHERIVPSRTARLAMLEGGQLILREPAELPRCDCVMIGNPTRRSLSLMFVPVRHGPSLIGVLSIQSYTLGAYDAHSLETLQALADHCAGALERIRAQEARDESEARYRQSEAQLRQSQKMEAVGHLAGGVAHDFNNLLAVMRGNCELLLMAGAQFSETNRDCLKQVVATADRAANLTRQLLAFSRKQVMRAQPLDLNDVVSNFTKMLKRIIGEDIQLSCNYAARLPFVQADVGMLEQVIVNLVVNARDAMPGGGQLFITTEVSRRSAVAANPHSEAKVGEFVCLSVTDTGSGIAAEHLPHIFEPFFTTKDVGKGTGLGLATAYGIVQQHEGWIEVASKVGAGTTFKILLPAIASPPASVSPAAPVAAKPAGGSETLLLVEDDEGVRSVTSRVLRSFGYKVHEADSGPRALELWSAHKGEIALVLTDVIMPQRLNGRELVELLLVERPGLKVIFMSGYSGTNLEANHGLLQRNRAPFLQKPCDLATLLGTIRESLDAKGDT